MRRIATAVALTTAWTAGGRAQGVIPDSVRQAAASAPLFATHDPLTLTVQAPLTTIFKERGQESEEFPGIVIHHQADGSQVALDVAIRTRGKTRLTRRICEFPPLRLDFDKDQSVSDAFRGQDKLKLVTHCQDGRAEHEQYVLQEYLVYRVLNLLTDLCFRARLARLTYQDTDGGRDSLTRYGFLIEDEEMLAARHDWEPVHIPVVPPDAMDPQYLALVEVFQYMIGNPDWSAFMGAPEDEECCHNTKPIGSPGAGPVFSVPYDFDITGIVNTRYADRLFRPGDRDLGIRRVRDRVYRGLCGSALLLPQVFAEFNQKKDAIYALYRTQPDLDPKIVEETLEYLEEFYTTINDPRRVEREFHQRCRG